MIDYADLIELGFERENSTDSVYTDRTGHQYFLLNKQYLFATLEFNIDEGNVTLYSTDFENNSQRAFTIDDLEELRAIDSFLQSQHNIFKNLIKI